jgi:hypothetical protein
MFSILSVWLVLKLLKRNGEVTVDGLYILTPIIADCYIITILITRVL